MQLFDLNGRVAVVTGGSTGIGLGIARGLAEAGAAVALAGLDDPGAMKAIAELKAFGIRSEFFMVDLKQAAACYRMIETIEQIFGRIDILVNNAGIVIRRRPEEYSEVEWRSHFDVNLDAAFFCAQAVYSGMRRRGGGKIINIASLLATLATPSTAAYAASKAAILQLTRALAVAWAADGIGVNAILPGWIDTAMTRPVRQEVPGLDERIVARTPAGRWGQPEDLAGTAIFLASAASDFITGAGILVDGGYGSLA